MGSFARRAASLVAATAVIVTSAVLSPTAFAAPTPTPTPPKTSRAVSPANVGPTTRHGTARVTNAQHDYSKMVHKATSPAHVNSKGQIDWRWVKKVFGKHTTSRDGFGAGWWTYKGWKQFTHMSKKDKKKIIAWSKTHAGPNPKSAKAVASADLPRSLTARPMAPQVCTGANDLYKVRPSTWWSYMNSCVTNQMVFKGTICSVAVTVVGAALVAVAKGKVAIPVGVADAFCIINTAWLAYARDQSTYYHATIVRVIDSPVRTNHNGKIFWLSPYWIYPQN